MLPRTMARSELKKKVQEAFSRLRAEKVGYPAKIVDDPVGRSFRICDGKGKEFLKLSLVDTKNLPENIGRYFRMKSPQREALAVKEVNKVVDTGSSSPEQVFAMEITESLREWVSPPVRESEIDIRINALEGKVPVPGTQIERVLAEDGLHWSIGLSQLKGPKRHFQGRTIEEAVSAAEKAFRKGKKK